MDGESLWNCKKNIRSFLYHKTEGTGIGLSLCRQIIKKDMGAISIYRKADKEKLYFVIEWPVASFYFEITKFITGSL